MGSGGMYDFYPQQWREANGYTPAHYVPQVAGSLYACTCGPYASVIPPEPCPIHDPERAYWRRKLLQEFGGQNASTNTTTSAEIRTATGRKPGPPEPQFEIPKYKSPVLEEQPVHFNLYDNGGEKLACGTDPTEDHIRWARVKVWVTCKDCQRELMKKN